jgi:hypothetical protein
VMAKVTGKKTRKQRRRKSLKSVAADVLGV